MDKPKAKRGRKKPQPKPKRTTPISLRLTKSEKSDWEDKASAVGLGDNLSQFIRYCVTNRRISPPPPAVNVMLYQQLGRIGNNINQIAYGINYALKVGHPIADDIDEKRSVIESLKPLLLEVKQQLMGIDKDQEPEE